ncbi:hypothetical protein A3860_38060 [Niastella vici]|uniref:Uncharacterized protein n=1 Tax=Niastella vici TaxID=1703345 RepID=A0A1V9FLN6_9BACT|nr:DUF6266 family protein [Niastella vici]OQP59262.1 hypothetical protein A3860_38060 [Niastella vici]
MARQINLFAFTGTLGNVVGYCYKGQYCLRSKPVHKSKKETLAQLKQREKFAKAIKFVSALSPKTNKMIQIPYLYYCFMRQKSSKTKGCVRAALSIFISNLITYEIH